jgi:post-segregation antitoxin (ccd killing protein)
MQTQSVRKKPTNLSLDQGLWNEARSLGVNLSQAAESGLKQPLQRPRVLGGSVRMQKRWRAPICGLKNMAYLWKNTGSSDGDAVYGCCIHIDTERPRHHAG